MPDSKISALATAPADIDEGWFLVLANQDTGNAKASTASFRAEMARGSYQPYANQALRDADTGQNQGTISRLNDTGAAAVWTGAAWLDIGGAPAAGGVTSVAGETGPAVTAAQLAVAIDAEADTNLLTDAERAAIVALAASQTAQDLLIAANTAHTGSPHVANIADLGDVDAATAPSTYLRRNAGDTAYEWAGIAPGPIDALTDVDTTTVAPTTGQLLQFDGTNWVPVTGALMLLVETEANLPPIATVTAGASYVVTNDGTASRNGLYIATGAAPGGTPTVWHKDE